jgi:hypothetical protein
MFLFRSEIFEVIFVVFRLMKNIIFNKTESFVGRNTSNHACQIFCSKSRAVKLCRILKISEVCLGHIGHVTYSFININKSMCSLYKKIRYKLHFPSYPHNITESKFPNLYSKCTFMQFIVVF